MSATQVGRKLLSWASDLEPDTVAQAARTAKLPFVEGHVALMPDAHKGLGSTVGSVVPTLGAVIPSCVGVDIGCGMVASETSLTAADLPDSLDALMPLVSARVPSGVGKGHVEPVAEQRLAALGRPRTELSDKQERTTAEPFGTLGSGNHFVEVCLDERDRVWTVLHSGSRGIGNQLAVRAIAEAKGLMKQRFIDLEDPDLAYLVQGEPSFEHYIGDMLWAQRYAMGSRAVMAEQVLASLFEVVGAGPHVRTINCHHNFTQLEHHGGKDLWITRKGAIKAGLGDEGVIPGSMGTRSYIVTGLGSAASYASCAHGAGRRMSRTAARKTLTVDSLREAMAGRAWNSDQAKALLDEHPASYKDIDQVMADQTDLVTVQHTLRQVFNYKGV
ncbi:MAG TPA: RtcB family protein [Mycobacteriales bacterium]|nr:RtcB family protein [Mycobacteriales bacterium]